MLRFALTRTAIWCASVLGAAVFAAALAALAVPGATATLGAFLLALAAKIPALFAFNLGIGKISGLAAGTEAAADFAATFELMLLSLIVAILAGVPLGILMVHQKARLAVAPLMQLAGSVPVFCAAIVIALVFDSSAAGLVDTPSLFAALGAGSHGAIAAAFAAMGPLVLTVGLAGAGAVAQSLSTALDHAMREPYREALHRLGLGKSEILRGFVARHAFALTLKDSGEILFTLFSAAAVGEWIFAWPGAGAAFIRAVALEDWTLVAVFIFVIALMRFSADFLGMIASRVLLGEDPPP